MPTVAAGAAAGTGGSVGAFCNNYDTDDATLVTLTTGAAATAAGILCVITWAQSWASNLNNAADPAIPKVSVTVVATNGNSSAAGIALGVIGAEWAANLQTLSLRCVSIPVINTTYNLSVIVHE